MSDSLKKTKSPKGELRWVNIAGEGKENLQGVPQYLASILLDDRVPEHAAYMDEIEAFWEENRPKGIDEAKSLGFYPLTEKSDDGKKVPVEHMFYATYKTGITFPDGSPKKVKTFNAKAVQVDLGDQRIGNGSAGRIAGAMDIYTVKDTKGRIMQAGVTLYLDAIMLTKFVPYTGSSPFDDEDADTEDGWTGADEDTGFEPEPDAPAATSTKAPPRI